MNYEEMNSVLQVNELTTLARLETLDTGDEIAEALWKGTITADEVIAEYDEEELEGVYDSIGNALEEIEEGNFWIDGDFTPQEIADGLLRLQDATERIGQENIRRIELKNKVLEEMIAAEESETEE